MTAPKKEDIRKFKSATIGHVDHGKTTLTAALCTILEGEKRSVSQIDNAPEERARGITINATNVRFMAQNRQTGKWYLFDHRDCPGHADLIKNMILGMHGAEINCLVVDANDGTMPQTKQHVMLSSRLGIKNIVVFMNKCDIADEDVQEISEMDIRQLLEENGYGDAPIIKGSALCALEGNPQWVEKIYELSDAITSLISDTPPGDETAPLVLPIDTEFQIEGRGRVAGGRLEAGTLKVGQKVEILGIGCGPYSAAITEIQEDHKKIDMARPGDNVGVLVKFEDKDKNAHFAKGMVICAPGSKKICQAFVAQCYVMQAHESGRSSGFRSGYRPQVYSGTANVTSTVHLPLGEELVMPGEAKEMLFILEKGLVLSGNESFVAREGGKTVLCGQISELILSDDQLNDVKKRFNFNR